MEKLVKFRLFESVAGRDFAYAKGENELPADRAAQFASEGLGEHVDTAALPHQKAEKATSKAAGAAEKRT